MLSGLYPALENTHGRRLISALVNCPIHHFRKETMVKVIYEGDDFKRMLRADKIALERLVSAGKTGIFEVKYKDSIIKVEIKKKGMDLVVKRFRAI